MALVLLYILLDIYFFGFLVVVEHRIIIVSRWVRLRPRARSHYEPNNEIRIFQMKQKKNNNNNNELNEQERMQVTTKSVIIWSQNTNRHTNAIENMIRNIENVSKRDASCTSNASDYIGV